MNLVDGCCHKKYQFNIPMDVAIEKNNSILPRKILGNNKDLLSAYIIKHFEFIKSNLKIKGMLLEIII